MTDYIQILTTLLGIMGGLAAGFILEHYRLKHELKVEKIKRVAPYLEQVSPTIKNLAIDSEYAVELQKRGCEDQFLLQRLCKGLKEFESWYTIIRQNGLEIELESLNITLSRSLLGIVTYAQLTSKYGVDYISQRLNSFHERCLIARKSLESLLG